MVTALYFFSFLASVVATLTLLFRNKRIDSLFILFEILIILNCFGKYIVSITPNIEISIIATKTLYLGACFCPIIFFNIIGHFCKIKFPKWINYGISIFATIIYCFVLTIDKNGLYYKEIQVMHEDGFYYLDKIYGPLHIFYPILMIICQILLIISIIYSIRNKNNISYRTIITITLLPLSIILCYMIEQILSLKISYVSILYLIAMCIINYLYERVNTYDISDNIIQTIDQMHEYAYIEFDKKYRLIAYNEYAKEIFPEIVNSWKIDEMIPPSNSLLYREVIEWLYQNNGNSKKTLQIDDCYYEIHLHDIIYNHKRIVGYIIEIVNRTMENKYLTSVKNYNMNLQKDVNQKTERIIHIKDMMVLGMASMVESRDNSTGGHIKRTSEAMKIFSKRLIEHRNALNLSISFLSMIVKAAPMHDLGKISVDDQVLRKQGKYTDEDYSKMKEHSIEGAKIVENILRNVEDDAFVDIARNVAHYHHEKWNGQGYPSGLHNADIPIEARIMALVDVFDALVSKRCYKEPFSYDEAFTIIEESLGSHFDPILGKIFIECRPELEKMYDQYKTNEK